MIFKASPGRIGGLTLSRLTPVKSNGCALKFAGDKLKAERDIVLEAVKKLNDVKGVKGIRRYFKQVSESFIFRSIDVMISGCSISSRIRPG